MGISVPDLFSRYADGEKVDKPSGGKTDVYLKDKVDNPESLLKAQNKIIQVQEKLIECLSAE